MFISAVLKDGDKVKLNKDMTISSGTYTKNHEFYVYSVELDHLMNLVDTEDDTKHLFYVSQDSVTKIEDAKVYLKTTNIGRPPGIYFSKFDSVLPKIKELLNDGYPLVKIAAQLEVNPRGLYSYFEKMRKIHPEDKTFRVGENRSNNKKVNVTIHVKRTSKYDELLPEIICRLNRGESQRYISASLGLEKSYLSVFLKRKAKVEYSIK